VRHTNGPVDYRKPPSPLLEPRHRADHCRVLAEARQRGRRIELGFAFPLDTDGLLFSRRSVERPGSKSARSPCVPLGTGTRDLFEALPIPVELRELGLMVEPFLGFEEAVRGLPWGAADSCRTLGLFAVEVARVTLACRCWLDGTRDRDAVWSSDRSARARLGGLRLAGGRRRRLSGAARLRGLLFDPPPGLAFGALFGAPISLRFSLKESPRPTCGFAIDTTSRRFASIICVFAARSPRSTRFAKETSWSAVSSGTFPISRR
jgi:hypothetical protein